MPGSVSHASKRENFREISSFIIIRAAFAGRAMPPADRDEPSPPRLAFGRTTPRTAGGSAIRELDSRLQTAPSAGRHAAARKGCPALSGGPRGNENIQRT
jgi:hypothetical protein